MSLSLFQPAYAQELRFSDYYQDRDDSFPEDYDHSFFLKSSYKEYVLGDDWNYEKIKEDLL